MTKEEWEEFIFDALLALSDEHEPEVHAEKSAQLYQCFGSYVLEEPGGPCYDDLKEWVSEYFIDVGDD